MNKNVSELYNRVLLVISEEFDIPANILLHSNDAECVQARTVLYVFLNKKGFSDKEIAACTGVHRESINRSRNRFREDSSTWLVKLCLEHLKHL